MIETTNPAGLAGKYDEQKPANVMNLQASMYEHFGSPGKRPTSRAAGCLSTLLKFGIPTTAISAAMSPHAQPYIDLVAEHTGENLSYVALAAAGTLAWSAAKGAAGVVANLRSRRKDVKYEINHDKELSKNLESIAQQFEVTSDTSYDRLSKVFSYLSAGGQLDGLKHEDLAIYFGQGDRVDFSYDNNSPVSVDSDRLAQALVSMKARGLTLNGATYSLENADPHDLLCIISKGHFDQYQGKFAGQTKDRAFDVEGKAHQLASAMAHASTQGTQNNTIELSFLPALPRTLHDFLADGQVYDVVKGIDDIKNNPSHVSIVNTRVLELYHALAGDIYRQIGGEQNNQQPVVIPQVPVDEPAPQPAAPVANPQVAPQQPVPLPQPTLVPDPNARARDLGIPAANQGQNQQPITQFPQQPAPQPPQNADEGRINMGYQLKD